MKAQKSCCVKSPSARRSQIELYLCRVKNRSPYFVGIAGGSASGKTSFLHALLQAFDPSEISLVSQDNYYRPASEQKEDENGWLNFDLPQSLHRDEYYRDLVQLSEGKRIERLEYTFNNPAVTPKTIAIEPTRIIITEGLFVFHYTEVWNLLNYKVFLHADANVRLQRRIQRDAVERGYPEAHVRYQWDNHVMPADHAFLQPHKAACDLIVDNDEHFTPGLDHLVEHLRTILNA